MIESKIIDKITPTINKILQGGFAEAGLTAMVEHVRNELMDYPPTTEANAPGRVKTIGARQVPIGYYERGRGYWSPRILRETIREHIQAAGGRGKSRKVIGAPRAVQSVARVAGYVLTGFSEQLNRKWTIASRSKAEVVLGTNVSYARFAQDAEKQARWMKKYGWITVQEILKRDSQLLKTKFLQEFKRHIKENG